MALTSKQRIAAATALATAIAIPAEGLRQFAYFDPPGILTVCYGHTGADVQKGRRYSLSECDALLSEDMRKAMDYVNRCVPGLPVPILAAFGDATYNLGPVVSCDTRNSKAARELRAGNYEAACNQLVRWDKARVLGVMITLPGLTKRRTKERDLCLTGLA
ncbi:lysozyme [Massilia sp. RP-1-19]|uniref:Lysozyme n=1 Tax=Massilia polaris TaxID=2728846 RepID=A0A848HKB7_9BURK|nr:lysozyme [Massilia polaris]NML61845.1 lysozyme [Massilia polaris]